MKNIESTAEVKIQSATPPRGNIDVFVKSLIAGWIEHPCTSSPPRIQILLDGSQIAEGLAGARRVDAEVVTGSFNVFGFVLPVGDGSWESQLEDYSGDSKLQIKVNGECTCTWDYELPSEFEIDRGHLQVESWDGREVFGWLLKPVSKTPPPVMIIESPQSTEVIENLWSRREDIRLTSSDWEVLGFRASVINPSIQNLEHLHLLVATMGLRATASLVERPLQRAELGPLKPAEIGSELLQSFASLNVR